MISSSDPGSSQGSAPRWEWQDLARVGSGAGDPEADAQAERDAQHAEELELTFQHGFKEGQMATRAELERRVRSATSAVAAAARALVEKQVAWEARLQDDLAALASGIARHVIDRELATAPEIVSELVGRAVALFPTDHALRVRVNPADLRTLAGPEDGSWGSGGERIQGRAVRWVPDEEIAPGGCVVEGPQGIVDGRVDEVLERIYRRLADG